MVVLKPRSRIVSFRLSEEEYNVMMETCISQGARSLSDYARMAACGEPADGRANARIEIEFSLLRSRVEELDKLVQELTYALRRARAAENQPATEAQSTMQDSIGNRKGTPL